MKNSLSKNTNTLIVPLAASLLLGIAPQAASAQEQQWIHQLSTTSYDWAYALAPNGAGGSFVGGLTAGKLVQRPVGGWDAFLINYDSAGNQLWGRQFGSTTGENLIDLAADGAGGVLGAGWTWGDLSGPNAGAEDAFLVHYDADGNQLWMSQFGSAESDSAYAIAWDSSGDVFVGGATEGDPGGPNAGGQDALVARHDSEGNQIWIRQFGRGGDEYVVAMAVDGVGGVVVAGATESDLGGPNAGLEDIFLARFDQAGNLVWLEQFGTYGGEWASDLTTDGAGNFFVTGTGGRVAGGPGYGSYDCFLARYDIDGNQIWIRSFGSSEMDQAFGVALDGMGGLLVTGSTYGGLGGPPKGKADIFLARFDALGDQVWMRQLGTTSYDTGRAVVYDGAQGVVVVATTEGSLAGPYAGNTDSIVARYTIDSCYADCDGTTGTGILDVFDFLCWQNEFVAGNSQACDCDMSTGPLVCDIFDFLCFQDAFVAGCP